VNGFKYKLLFWQLEIFYVHLDVTAFYLLLGNSEVPYLKNALDRLWWHSKSAG
jgi:hypothetical protein